MSTRPLSFRSSVLETIHLEKSELTPTVQLIASVRGTIGISSENLTLSLMAKLWATLKFLEKTRSPDLLSTTVTDGDPVKVLATLSNRE